MGRRAPRPVSAAISTALETATPRTLLADVQTCWAAAVGTDIARQAEPVSERGGVVTVACASAAWAEQLELMQDQVLSHLHEEIGDPQRPRGLRFSALSEA